MLALACFVALRAWPRSLLPAGAALLTAWCAATALADMQQCWQPQSRNLKAIKQRLLQLKDLHAGDIVVISNTPMRIGTAQHFAMILSYCSTPFVELVTGVDGLEVGRDILADPGRLGLQHVDFVHELKRDDLRRIYVLLSDGVAACSLRTLFAREVHGGQYELHPLKGYTGAQPPPDRTYSREELRAIERDIYFPHRHLQ